MIPSSDIFETSPLRLREYDRLVNPASRGGVLPLASTYFDLITSDYKSILKEHLLTRLRLSKIWAGGALGP